MSDFPRPLRRRNAPPLTVVPAVPWGTKQNPSRIPYPRGEEWRRVTLPPDPDDVAYLERVLAQHPERAGEIFGDGFVDVRSLSAHAADMAVITADLVDGLHRALEDADKELTLMIAGTAYKAHPVRPCRLCRRSTPHTYAIGGGQAMCLVCGERTDA